MKKVLVALDMSDRAGNVLRAAAAHAALVDARLLLLRVVTPVQLPTDLMVASPVVFAAHILDDARADLQARANSLPQGQVESVKVELGSPWKSIVDTAAQEKADMIFIGAQGYHMVDRALGTTAARVVNHASCPITVVRPSPAGTSVMAALDMSDHAPHVLAAASEAARARGATLSLIRVVPELGNIPMRELGESLETLTQSIVKRSRQDLEYLRESLGNVRAGGIQVRVGTPWREICAQAKGDQTSLIVLGRHGHSALARAVGTNAARVVNHAECSVLVVPAPPSGP